MNARSVVAGLARLASRRLLDPNPVPRGWDNVTKVDPEPAKRLPLLYPLHLAGTDAVEVGGSQGVTAADAAATFDLLAPLSTPTLQEPSGPEQVTPETVAAADLLAVPEVLNGDSAALVGDLGAAVERIEESFLPSLLDDATPWLPDSLRRRVTDWGTDALLGGAAFEAYVVQNPESAAAREAGVGEDDVLSPTEARQRAVAAERHLDSEIVYLEYSGTFGGEEARETLRELSGALDDARLWYGGGLADAESVAAVRAAGADTVVVGDAFHRAGEAEAALLAAADDADLPADADAVREWVADEYDPTVAADYLATQPGVSDPDERARRAATAAVLTWLTAGDLADDIADGDLAGPRAAAESLSPTELPARDALAAVVEGDAQEFCRDLLATLVAARLNGFDEVERQTDDDLPFPTDHLALPDLRQTTVS